MLSFRLGWLPRNLAISVTVLVTACSGVVGTADPTTPGGSAGSVTFAELEAAAARTVQCLEENGLSDVTANYDAENYSFGFEWALPGDSSADPSSSEIERGEAVAVECARQHLDAVAAAWQEMHRAEIEAANRAFEQRIIRCLREQGIEVTELNPTTVGQIDADHPGVRDQCFNRALDEEALERERSGSTTTLPDSSG